MPGEYVTYVYPSPPEGFGWEVSKEGQIVLSGIARTEAEASITAEGIADELEAAEAKKK